MIGELASGAVAGLAVAMPVGAVGSYLIGLSARERRSTAAAAALGIASVDGIYAILAALIGAGLHELLNEATGWLSWVAAITLVLIAVHTMRLAIRRYRGHAGTLAQHSKLSPARAYLSLFMLTAINPATVITFAAVVGRSLIGSSWLALALFALGAFVASAAWQLLLAAGGGLLGQLLRGRRGQLGISLSSALIMLALSAGVLLS
ncbi:MAG TPA: LysE family transporter [Propionibacteriaceae bacterium]